MTKEQAGGYLFEAAIWELLKKSGYIQVRETKLKGRSGLHQIDAVGYWKIPVPFIYPVRLMIEAKFKPKSDLSEIRSFLGAFIDIQENYFVRGKSRSARYTDAACMCCKGSFSREAQDYAWAHNIFLISFQNIVSLSPIISKIEHFLETMSLESIESKEQLISSFNVRRALSSLYNQNDRQTILIVGMLNSKYPVMLSTNHSLIDLFKERVSQNGDVLRAVKTERRTSNGDLNTVYQISFIEDKPVSIEFSLPNYIAYRLSEHIDSMPTGKKIFDIEVPSIIKTERGETRRIFRIDVILG